jgi:hypothetical protein
VFARFESFDSEVVKDQIDGIVSVFSFQYHSWAMVQSWLLMFRKTFVHKITGNTGTIIGTGI